MAAVPSSVSMGVGIERVLFQREAAAPSLPGGNSTLPAETAIPQELASLLSPPSIEQSLLESLRPEIQQRELLTPTGWQRARTECLAEVQQALQASSDPSQTAALQQLVNLLEQDGQLRDLLNAYRNMLHRA